MKVPIITSEKVSQESFVEKEETHTMCGNWNSFTGLLCEIKLGATRKNKKMP